MYQISQSALYQTSSGGQIFVHFEYINVIKCKNIKNLWWWSPLCYGAVNVCQLFASQTGPRAPVKACKYKSQRHSRDHFRSVIFIWILRNIMVSNGKLNKHETSEGIRWERLARPTREVNHMGRRPRREEGNLTLRAAQLHVDNKHASATNTASK